MYNRRTWLNKEGSPSTGSVVSYHGTALNWADEEVSKTFFEVADCSFKVRLHPEKGEEMSNFVSKLRLLASEASNFADFLESNCRTVIDVD